MATTLSNAGLETLPEETYQQFAHRAITEHERRGDFDEANKWRFAIGKHPLMTEDERAEVGYLTADCPLCYVDHHQQDDARDLGLAWYYCGGCGAQWYPERSRRPERDLLVIGINIAFVIALAIGFVYSMLGASLLARDVWHWDRDSAVAASLWIGIPAWIGGVLIFTVVFHVLNVALHDAVDYVWGAPLDGNEQ